MRRRKSRVVARTGIPAVPLRFAARAWVAEGADSTATTRSKLGVSCGQRGRRRRRGPRQVRPDRVLRAHRNPLDERIDQPAVHLEKCAVVYAVIETCSAIVEGGCAPLRDGARRLGGRLGPSITNSAPRSAGIRSCERLRELFEINFFCACGGDADQQRRFVGVAEKRNFGGTQAKARFAGRFRRTSVRHSTSNGAAMGHSLMGITA